MRTGILLFACGYNSLGLRVVIIIITAVYMMAYLFFSTLMNFFSFPFLKPVATFESQSPTRSLDSQVRRSKLCVFLVLVANYASARPTDTTLCFDSGVFFGSTVLKFLLLRLLARMKSLWRRGGWMWIVRKIYIYHYTPIVFFLLACFSLVWFWFGLLLYIEAR